MTDTSREALIRELRSAHAGHSDEGPSTFSDAADMLEADAPHRDKQWHDTAWQRGFQAGVNSSEKTAKDAVAALEAEKVAHMATNRTMTEALMQAEAQQVAVPEMLSDDKARLDWLDQNIFNRENLTLQGKVDQSYNMWVMFSPRGTQGSAGAIIDAAIAHDIGAKS